LVSERHSISRTMCRASDRGSSRSAVRSAIGAEPSRAIGSTSLRGARPSIA
jgi:hypothetical protein